MTSTDNIDQSQVQEALNQSNSLDAIKKEIDDLRNKETSDDKLELNGLLTSEFSKNLSPEEANQLLKSIEEVLNNNPEFKEKKPEGLDDLIKFLKPLTNPLSFSGAMVGLDDKGGKFWGKIEISKEGQDSEIDTISKDIKTKLSEINAINDDRLNGVKDILNQAMVVINKPGKNNTNILQKFIYENLPDNLKEGFGIENHFKNGNFDGQFGKSTLNGLKQILTVADEIISDIKEAKSVENKGDQEKSRIDEDKRVAAEEAEKKAKEIKERINKIITGLGLKIVIENGLDRKEFGLPSEGILYTGDGQDGYYYFDKDVDIVFVPLNPMIDVQKLAISNYKEGVNRNEQSLKREKLKDYPAVNEYGRQSLEITLKSRLMGTTLGNYPCSIKIDNNLYKLNSFGHLASIPKEYFIDGWLFKRNDKMDANEKEEQIRNDSKFLNLANYLFKKFDGKIGQYEIKDNGKLVFKLNDGKEKTGIGKYELENEYGKLNESQIKIFCDYLNNSGNIGNSTVSNGNNGATTEAQGNTSANSSETNDIGVDSFLKQSGLILTGNAPKDYGLPEGNIYRAKGDITHYYFISSDNKSLIRVSTNFSEGRSVLPLSKFNNGIQDLSKQKWETLKVEGYPPVNEEGRKYYENILKKSIGGVNRLRNTESKIIIDYDKADKMQKYKLVSFGYKKVIEADTLSKGWLFHNGKLEDHLGKDFRVISLINSLLGTYRGKVPGCQFDLKNGEQLVLKRPNGKEEIIIGKAEWKRDYGKLDNENDIDNFNYRLNKETGGVFDEIQINGNFIFGGGTLGANPNGNNDNGSENLNGNNDNGSENLNVNNDNGSENLNGNNGNGSDNPNGNNDNGSDNNPEQEEIIDIKTLSKDEIKLKALTPNIQRSKYLNSCKGMISEAFNLAIKSEVKDKKILLDLRDGLTGPFNDKIRVVQEFLGVGNTSGVFGEITFKKLLEHYNIPYKAEWKNLRLNIRNEGEEEKNKENQNNRLKECMQLISDRRNLLQEYNWGAYDNKVAAFKEEYINGNIKDKEDFVKKLDDVFFNNDWIYKWKGKADVKYTYKGKLNEKGNPISGRVDFEINGNPLYYEGSWDKDGRIVKCKSKGDVTKEEYSINIYYKAGSIPYFSTSNGLNLSLKLIGNNDVADIGRIASMINSMTSTVRRNVIGMERHFDGVKVGENLHGKDAKNGLIAVFKGMERNVNLKSNVMESMYLRDNEEDVIRWFNQYFNEQLKNGYTFV